MQDTQKAIDKKALVKRILNYLKWIIPLGMLLFLYSTLKNTFSSDQFIDTLKQLQSKHILIIILFVLAYINWGLEALKWKKLVQEIQKISFFQSYKSILMGLGISLTIPRSIGEVFGRLWGISEKGREAVIGALLISRGFQLSTTLLGGFASILYFLFTGKLSADLQKVAWIGLFVFIGLVITLFAALQFSKQENKLTKYIKTLKTYTLQQLIQIWSLAFLRFCVYATQYYLVINSLVEESGVALFAGILLVYLIKSIVPSTHALSDEFVRQSSAIIVFSYIGIPKEAVIISSTVIWLLNLLLPSVIGIFFMPSAKFFLKETK